MNERTQLDGSIVSFNTKKEKKKAEAALEIAKSLSKPVIFLPKGYSHEIEKLKKEKLRKQY